MTWTDVDLAEKLWNASYAVTAFATAQGMSYLYALAGDEFKAKVRGASKFISQLIIGCHLIYILLVVGCHIGIGSLVAADFWTWASAVNIAICAMQALAIVAVGALAFTVTTQVVKKKHVA